MHERGGEVVQRRADGPLGERREHVGRLARPARRELAGLGDDGVLAQRRDRLRERVVRGQVRVEQREQLAVRGSSGAAARSRSSRPGIVGTFSRRSVPGVWPVTAASEVRSMSSSASWKATPTFSPNSVMTRTTSGGQPANIAPKRPEVATSEPVLSARTCR